MTKSLNRSFILALVLFASTFVTVNAQNVTNRFFTTFAKESLTVSTAAVPFTAATYDTASARAQLASFTVRGCIVNIWSTGDSPTSTVGVPAPVGANVRVYGYDDIRHFKAIRDTSCAVDATLSVQYSR